MATTTQAPEISTPAYPAGESGIWSWVTTVDHKRIGILYLVTALAFFIGGGIEALIIRIQLARPELQIVAGDTFNQLFTMHGTSMIFLAIMPLNASFFNFIIPLMIGARDVAYPRLNAFSYWLFLFGGLFLNASFIGGAPDVGWFAYAPLTERGFAPGTGVEFWILGLALLGVASIVSSMNFIVTILNMRAPGMTFRRLPVFIWMSLITSFLVVFAFPPFTVATILLFFDRLLGSTFFIPAVLDGQAAGGNPLLWQHMFWFFGHPEVYILILPAMGIVSEVLPTFSRKPLFGYTAVVFSGVSIGFLGFTVWAHHMFVVGLGALPNSVFAASTMLIAIPTGVKVLNWSATLYKGSISLKTPFYFAVGFLVLFTIGGLSGMMHASPPVDAQQSDSYWIVAHLHYVLFGGALMGIFAGLYYWIPKMSGRILNDRIGQAQFWLMFIGMNVAFGPMHILGNDGMTRRIYTYAADQGWDAWNMVATIGSFLIAVSILVFFYNVFVSLFRGDAAGNDPWDGQTLEWSISSPPPVYNFATVPVVGSNRPHWDAKYGGAPSQSVEAEESVGDIHMPPPSYWPIFVALSLTLSAVGLIYSYPLVAVSMVATVAGIMAWAKESVEIPPDGSNGRAH